jgi:hypothetical protein
MKPDTTLVGIVVSVSVPGQEPYEAGAAYAVPDAKIARPTPNAVLPVKVDRSNPAIVAVDWDSV